MKMLSAALLGACLCGTFLAQQTPPPKTHLKEGDMAPDFTLPSTNPFGSKVTLSDFKGKSNVILAFFPAAFSPG